MPAPGLILFDIDGTLLRRAGPHHREALVAAVRAVTGLETRIDHIPTQGMLDRDILRQMLREAKMDTQEIQNCMPQLMRRAQWLYSRRCPEDLRDRVCPGVPQLLTELRRRRAIAALVTGNLELIGWKKMERAGLKRYFDYGAFSDHGETRTELVSFALKEARRRALLRRSTPVALIGDHPNDIKAARKNGVRAIAVATGVVPAEELKRHRPDLLLADLSKLNPETLLQ